MTTFQELGIRASLCDVLRNHGIKEATPVQEKAMPLVRAGSDCIVKAQTGTGKTLAFLLPIIENYPPPATKGKYIKIKYVMQLPTPTPQFACFVNLPQYIKDPYRRFLENKIREEWDFSGVPIQIYFRQK